nr:protein phosphatase 2C domain-containing protein [Candidatus Njordarchaeota archaeon]
MKREDLSYNTASTKEVGNNLILLYCSVLNDAHGDDYGGVFSSDFVSGVAIADGVTGTEKGSIASRIAVEESLSLIKSLDTLRSKDMTRNIKGAFSTMVNRLPELIRKKMGQKVTSSGTTLAVAITDLARLYVFNIGDSDIFLYPFVKDYSSISSPDYMKLSAGFSGGPVLLHSVSDSGLEGRIDHVQLEVPTDGFALLLGSDGADLKNKVSKLFENLSVALNQYQKSHEAGKEMISETIQSTLVAYLKKEKAKDDDGTVALMILLPKRSENYYRGYMSIARSTKQSVKLELQGGNVPAEVRNLFQEVTIDTVPNPAFEGHLEIRMLDRAPALEGIGLYKLFEISTRGNGNYTLKNLNIVFKVEQEWLSRINVDAPHVRVFRIDKGPEQFEPAIVNQKGKYYFYSANLNSKGKYAIGVPEGKMLESKLKNRLDEIESKNKALNDKVDGISSELLSKNKSQQKLIEDNASKIRGELNEAIRPIREELNEIGNKIDKQRNDFDRRFKSIETRTTALENTTSDLQAKKEKGKDITDKLNDIGTRIEQQQRDFENKTRTLDTGIRNLTEQVRSLRNEKAETKRSQEAPNNNSATRQELSQGR